MNKYWKLVLANSATPKEFYGQYEVGGAGQLTIRHYKDGDSAKPEITIYAPGVWVRVEQR